MTPASVSRASFGAWLFVLILSAPVPGSAAGPNEVPIAFCLPVAAGESCDCSVEGIEDLVPVAIFHEYLRRLRLAGQVGRAEFERLLASSGACAGPHLGLGRDAASPAPLRAAALP
ncbi:hypothetical protein [Paracraurococcus lichenis]|uniref:Uncharacterized protein n=1 Tax=Paracraurococcus lichenis TaxID=3064888 RepID=A0ABT9E6Z3_9PROT|nr:hypothetical protein [Paracraurococcus sp. LOR1-02]MDO9711924.1 hypothetical protein [Paracraurococcus sp. LOR1-02]